MGGAGRSRGFLLSHLPLVELAVINVTVSEGGDATALHDVVHPVPIIRRLGSGLVNCDLFPLALPPGMRGTQSNVISGRFEGKPKENSLTVP